MAGVNEIRVSPDLGRTMLEATALEEKYGAPITASDSGHNQMCAPQSSVSEFGSYVRVGGPDALVTGSLMRTYYNIDATGAEVKDEPPQEVPSARPNAAPPEDDVLSDRDLYEYPASDGSESTADTPQPKNQSQDNTSCGSSDVVTDTPVLVVSSRYTLKASKMSQMIRKRKPMKLMSQEMKVRSKHNPALHFKLVSHTSSLTNSSNANIALRADIDVPRKYNRVLETAKFKISVAIDDHSASNLPQPQPQTFTLVQERKHIVFQLFSHSFVLNSTRSSVDLIIEVQPIYSEETVRDYLEKNPTDSVDYVEIRKRRVDSLSDVSVILEKQVSVTNEEQTIELKEHGLTLHVPKDSLPANCDHTHLTVIIAKPYPSNQTQDSQHSRHILYGFKCIDGEQPKLVTLKTGAGCHGAVDILPPQGSELSTLQESTH